MGDITSATAVLTLAVPPLFGSTQLQGFATDDVFDIPAIQSVETLMGVDGVLSGGFVYVEVPYEISLQADSLSNLLFDQWWTQMQATQATYTASGLIKLPGVATKFTLTNGFLKSYKPAPQAKKILQPRKFMLTWQSIAPAPNQ